MEVLMLRSVFEDITEMAALAAFLATIYAWSGIFA
jgi:hypothetical protein